MEERKRLAEDKVQKTCAATALGFCVLSLHGRKLNDSAEFTLWG